MESSQSMDDLVQHNLDNWVAAEPKALDVTRSRLNNTIVVLEPLVEKMKGKVKSKTVHVIDSQEVGATTEIQQPD